MVTFDPVASRERGGADERLRRCGVLYPAKLVNADGTHVPAGLHDLNVLKDDARGATCAHDSDLPCRHVTWAPGEVSI
jgi:hypothetical protein